MAKSSDAGQYSAANVANVPIPTPAPPPFNVSDWIVQKKQALDANRQLDPARKYFAISILDELDRAMKG